MISWLQVLILILVISFFQRYMTIYALEKKETKTIIGLNKYHLESEIR